MYPRERRAFSDKWGGAAGDQNAKRSEVGGKSKRNWLCLGCGVGRSVGDISDGEVVEVLVVSRNALRIRSRSFYWENYVGKINWENVQLTIYYE